VGDGQISLAPVKEEERKDTRTKHFNLKASLPE